MAKSPECLREVGHSAGHLLLPKHRWIHRRVQSVAHLEPRLTNITVSVDFEIPEVSSPYLPVSVLPKWPPLFQFDFRNQEDQPVPLLTSRQNGAADQGLLERLVEETCPEALGREEFAQALRQITCGPDTDLEPHFETLLDEVLNCLATTESERLLEVAAQLTSTTMLWIPVDGEPGERRICKFRYLLKSSDLKSRFHRFTQSLSWCQPWEWIRLHHSGGDANFHLEITAPPGLVVKEIESPAFIQFMAADSSESEHGAPGSALGHFTDFESGLGHVYLSGPRPVNGDLPVKFAPPRAGRILPPLAFATLIATLATALTFVLDQIQESGSENAATAILILVPALAGYVALRPEHHSVTRRHLAGIKVLIGLASIIPVAMAVTLVGSTSASLEEQWRVSTIVAWAVVVLLAISLRGASNEHHEVE